MTCNMKKLFLCAFAAALLTALWCVAAAADQSGTCGDGLTWKLDAQGTLTISGRGDMTDFGYQAAAPWGTGVKTVSIENGVTGIGDQAFAGCSGLSQIAIPDSVTRIGSFAFYSCSALREIAIPRGVR